MIEIGGNLKDLLDTLIHCVAVVVFVYFMWGK